MKSPLRSLAAAAPAAGSRRRARTRGASSSATRDRAVYVRALSAAFGLFGALGAAAPASDRGGANDGTGAK